MQLAAAASGRACPSGRRGLRADKRPVLSVGGLGSEGSHSCPPAGSSLARRLALITGDPNAVMQREKLEKRALKNAQVNGKESEAYIGSFGTTEYYVPQAGAAVAFMFAACVPGPSPPRPGWPCSSGPWWRVPRLLWPAGPCRRIEPVRRPCGAAVMVWAGGAQQGGLRKQPASAYTGRLGSCPLLLEPEDLEVQL
jgi:hypothetical protein